MREKYIAPTIMLAAGAIISVLNIVDNMDLLESLKRLLLVLVLFYIIGKVATKIIVKAINYDKKSVETEDMIQIEEDKFSENAADNEKQ